MDTVTHMLIGAAISDSWFRKRLGAVATPFALAVSALPDIDMLTALWSPESVWSYHRGITHAFLPMLLAAPLLGYLGWHISGRRVNWRLWGILACLCLFVHTFLDLSTSWGTMPLLPFSNGRFSWDLVPILDIFLLSASAASFVANRVLRWERVDTFLNPLIFPVVHRHPNRQRAGDWTAKVISVLIVCYLLVAVHQNRQTVRIARESLSGMGVEATEVRALPVMFTYIAWNIAARDVGGTVYNAVHSSYAPGPLTFTRYVPLPFSEVEAELSSPSGRLFRWYSQNMFVSRRGDDGAVVLEDRRFFLPAHPEKPNFSMQFEPRVGSGVGSVPRGIAKRRGFGALDAGEEFERLWSLTWHGDVVKNGVFPLSSVGVSVAK